MASSSASASSSQSTVLPTITIQHTFTEVLNDVHSGKVPSEKFWVSIYKQGQESVHARILAELDEADRDLVVLQSPDVSFEGRGREFSVSCEKMGLAKTRVLVPIQTYVDSDRADRHERITALAIAPTRTHYATGGLAGDLFIYPILPPKAAFKVYHDPASSFTESEPYARSTSHLSTVTSLAFFPSSKVLLTTSGDFSLSIFPAGDKSSQPATPKVAKIAPARTLKAHTRAVNDSAMIGLGKQVVSAGADGTVRVWDVGKGESVHGIWGDSEVVAVEVTSCSTAVWAHEGTKLLIYAALATGTVAVYSILTPTDMDLSRMTSQRTGTTERPSGGGLLTCMAMSEHFTSTSHHQIVATGFSTGLISLYQASMSGEITATPFAQARRGTETTRIESMAFLPFPATYDHIASASREMKAKLVVGAADGTTCVLAISLPAYPSTNANDTTTTDDGDTTTVDDNTATYDSSPDRKSVV